MKRLTIYATLITLLSTGIASSCGCSSETPSASDSLQIRPVEKADSPAYHLGYNEGRRLLEECQSRGEIRDRLLDLRAREHIIRSQMKESAADAYIYGIEHAIRESGDTLAAAIL